MGKEDRERPVCDGQGSGRRSPPAVRIPPPSLQPKAGDHIWHSRHTARVRAEVKGHSREGVEEAGNGERRPGREREEASKVPLPPSPAAAGGCCLVRWPSLRCFRSISRSRERRAKGYVRAGLSFLAFPSARPRNRERAPNTCGTERSESFPLSKF